MVNRKVLVLLFSNTGHISLHQDAKPLRLHVVPPTDLDCKKMSNAVTVETAFPGPFKSQVTASVTVISFRNLSWYSTLIYFVAHINCKVKKTENELNKCKRFFCLLTSNVAFCCQVSVNSTTFKLKIVSSLTCSCK